MITSRNYIKLDEKSEFYHFYSATRKNTAIGNGKLEDEIREMIKEEDVEDCVFI